MSIVGVYPPMRGLANTPWYYGFGGLSPSASSSSGLTTLTASATTHTKGSWSQLVASTADETGLVVVSFSGTITAATEVSVLLDLATGGSGSEVAFAENIAIGGADNVRATTASNAYFLPVYIPAGRRLAGRIQANIASRTASVGVGLYRTTGMQMLPTSLDVLGTSTATSRGTAMSGASGTYAEIIASTTRRYRAIVIVPSNPQSSNLGGGFVRLTAATGAAGAEVSVGSVQVFSLGNTGIYSFSPTPTGFPIAVDIPAGSRIAVQHNASSNPGHYAVTVIGVP